MSDRRSKHSVMRPARPISALVFLLWLAALPLACSPLGITGPEPSCYELAEADFPTGQDCNPVLAD